MKLVAAWLVTMVAFWLWFALSLHDLSFGLFVFSREFHQTIMAVYGWTLGVEPARVPGLLANAFALDGVLVIAILAFRRRRRLAAWLAETRSSCLNPARRSGWKRAGRAHPAE